MKKVDKHRIALITTNALGFPPFVFHRAIKFWSTDGSPLIIHRTTSGIEITDYGTFMKGRKILREETYPIRFDFDPIQIKATEPQKFDWFENNCEDFTSHVIENSCGKQMRPASPQRTIWIAVFGIILLLMVIAKQ